MILLSRSLLEPDQPILCKWTFQSINSKCVPQLQTADKLMAPRGRATQPPRDTRKTNQAKQPALSSPSR